MSQYTYEEIVEITLTNAQKTAFATFLGNVTTVPVADIQGIQLRRGDSPGEVVMTIRGQRVKNCTNLAQAEALLDDVLAGKVARVTLKV